MRRHAVLGSVAFLAALLLVAGPRLLAMAGGLWDAEPAAPELASVLVDNQGSQPVEVNLTLTDAAGRVEETLAYYVQAGDAKAQSLGQLAPGDHALRLVVQSLASGASGTVEPTLRLRAGACGPGRTDLATFTVSGTPAGVAMGAPPRVECVA